MSSLNVDSRSSQGSLNETHLSAASLAYARSQEHLGPLDHATDHPHPLATYSTPLSMVSTQGASGNVNVNVGVGVSAEPDASSSTLQPNNVAYAYSNVSGFFVLPIPSSLPCNVATSCLPRVCLIVSFVSLPLSLLFIRLFTSRLDTSRCHIRWCLRIDGRRG